MGEQIYGTFEGLGPNAPAALATVLKPDVPTEDTNVNNAGKGRTSALTMDERRRLRTSGEPARAGVAINVAGGDQTPSKPSRAVYVSVTGNLVCRLADDTIDTTWSNLPVGWHPLAVAVVRQAGTTASGNLAF